MMRRLISRTVWIILLLGQGNALWGQTDTLALPEVTVESIIPFSGERKEALTKSDFTLNPAGHLGNLLNQSSGVFVKSYGSGSSATTSIRGGSAEHTLVLWNGLPLENPMLGQFDFSLLPAFFFDEVAVHYGSNTAAWGNGAIGGTVQLGQNTTAYRPGLTTTLNISMGDFGFSQQSLKFVSNHKNITSVSRLFYKSEENDFTYQIRSDLPEKRQTNAAFSQYGWLQELRWRATARHQIELQFWHQQTDRQIPPTTTQNSSSAYQLDGTNRLAVHWKYTGDQWLWKAQAAWYNENQAYYDPDRFTEAQNRFKTGIGKISTQRHLGNIWQVNGGLQYIGNWATSNGYDERKRMDRLASWIGIMMETPHWKAQMSWRQEWQDGKRLPLVPSLGLDFRPMHLLTFRGRITRNYRSPNINALYWQPGGNPNLRAESGWSQELGFEIGDKMTAGHELGYSATAFRRKISNWIMWGRLPGDIFYSANNLTEVKSRGIEQRINWTIREGDWTIAGRHGYDFILSTNEIALTAPSIPAGKQLAYTPEHQAFSQLNIQYQRCYLNYQHRISGTVNTLNLSTLPGYEIGDLSFGVIVGDEKLDYRMGFSIFNIWNKNYRIIESRVMPRRYFQLHLSLSFNK